MTTETNEQEDDLEQGDLFFWLGQDGELIEQETYEEFCNRMYGERENERAWREVDVNHFQGEGVGGLRDDTDGGAYFYFDTGSDEV